MSSPSVVQSPVMPAVQQIKSAQAPPIQAVVSQGQIKSSVMPAVQQVKSAQAQMVVGSVIPSQQKSPIQTVIVKKQQQRSQGRVQKRTNVKYPYVLLQLSLTLGIFCIVIGILCYFIPRKSVQVNVKNVGSRTMDIVNPTISYKSKTIKIPKELRGKINKGPYTLYTYYIAPSTYYFYRRFYTVSIVLWVIGLFLVVFGTQGFWTGFGKL